MTQNISPLKIPFEKYKSFGWLSEFYVRYVSDIDANSFAYFQPGASNSEKDKLGRKEELGRIIFARLFSVHNTIRFTSRQYLFMTCTLIVYRRITF